MHLSNSVDGKPDMFLADYGRRQPVVVYGPDGRFLGAPCGFVMFAKYGISWATDAVLDKLWTGSPEFRHLDGKVTYDDGDFLCQGYRFASADRYSPQQYDYFQWFKGRMPLVS